MATNEERVAAIEEDVAALRAEVLEMRGMIRDWLTIARSRLGRLEATMDEVLESAEEVEQEVYGSTTVRDAVAIGLAAREAE